jgi:pectate lyase
MRWCDYRALLLLPCLVAPALSGGPLWGDKGQFELVGFGKDNPIGPTTGGKGGPTITVKTVAELEAAVQGSNPAIVRLDGKFTLTRRLVVGSNKSLLGVGRGAQITQSGINVFSQTNVIIRNLHISFVLDNDSITIQNSTRVWVDHNEFTSDITAGVDVYVCDFSSWGPNTN